MKKPILIIVSVAILGILGMYVSRSPGTTAKNSFSPVAMNNSPIQNAPMNTSPPASGSTPSGGSSSGGTPSSGSSSSANYKNGTFTGAAENIPYGTVQIAVVVSGGKITDVNYLQMPNDLPHSQAVTAYVKPYLKQMTIQNQSPNISFISGATVTSYGYQQSLQSALDQAKLN